MKIAIATPCHRDVKARFASSLVGLVSKTMGSVSGLQIESFLAVEGSVAVKRTRAALRAREWGADWILWADSDQVFPADALLRMLRHDKLIVGCNIATRVSAAPTAIAADGRRLQPGSGLVEVTAVGLGFCLMKAPIFERVPQLWFEEKHNATGEVEVGEDVHFCRQARSVGIPIYVDQDIDVGHIAEDIKTLDRGIVNARSVSAPARHQ